MPELLSEMNNLSIITPVVQDVGVPRYANPPSTQDNLTYQNWTMIEDVLDCQTRLPPVTQLSYMPSQYNSNGLIPAYQQAVCPSRAQQALINLTRNPPANNIYVPPQQLYGQSFQSQVAQYNHANPQYTTAFPYPPFAGSVPGMKNAKTQDVAVPLVEGYAHPRGSTHGASGERDKCIECLRHMDGCNLCQRLSKQSTRKYWAGIILLIILIGVLVAYICYLKRKYNSGSADIGGSMLRGITIE